jgi:hypothetical protein
MPFDYPNIIPENNLRLPDAINIEYGPARLLSRFLLEGDKAARNAGVQLRVRHDFDELVYVNEHYARSGSWYPLVRAYDPRYVELTPENAYWISGENATGEIVLTQIHKIYNWTETNLEAQARALWYGRDAGQPCIVTAEAAKLISGVAASGAGFWVRPDFRGRHLSHWLPRIGKAYACTRWPVDWLFCYIGIENVRRGIAANYGQKHLSYSVHYPGSPLGEQVLAYTSADELYEDIAGVLETNRPAYAADLASAFSGINCEQVVTKTSPDGVFHGNISLA